MTRALTTCALALAVATGLSAGHAQVGVSPPSATFADLFAAYRHGDADAAVDAFSKWTPDRVSAEATLGPDITDADSLGALALLHTEAGIRSGAFGRFAPNRPAFLILGDWGLGNAFEVHAASASRLIDDLTRRARGQHDAALLAFCKNWYIVAISFCKRSGLSDCTAGLLDKGNREFTGKNDPEYLLLIGSMSEPRRTAGYRDDRRQPVSWTSAAAQKARWAFTRALSKDPHLVEARLRLGRVYFVTNERERAERELTQALKDAAAGHRAFEGHLAALFLGELYEDEGRLDKAVDAYWKAVESNLFAHTASVALAQALVRTGHATEGWDVVRRMFGDEGLGGAPVADPYTLYPYGLYWQIVPRIRTMRERVRR